MLAHVLAHKMLKFVPQIALGLLKAKFIGWYDKIDVQHYNPLVSNRNIFGKLIAFNWQCSFRFNKSDKF